MIYLIAIILIILAFLVQKGWINIELKMPSSNTNNKVQDNLFEEKINNNEIENNSPLIEEKKNNTVTQINPEMIKIFYGTQKGTALGLAKRLMRECKEKWNLETQMINLENYDGEEYLAKEKYAIFIVSTYTDGKPTESTKVFYEWLDDAANDFRFDKGTMHNLKYAIFGLGNSVYGENFNVVAKNIDKNLKKLSAKQMLQLGSGDGQYAEEMFEKWLNRLLPSLLVHSGRKNLLKQNKINQKKKNLKIETEEEEEVDVDDDEDEASSTPKEPVIDLEDLGNSMKKEGDQEEEEEGELDPNREMLTPSLRKSLTKQGYKLIGSHSGVKLCRWTKAMLRGRGGCYKHTFYGIESYRCMEMTPSLACANKCVFCWRHHSNPVGTEWKWKMDEPQFLVDEATKKHVEMIKQLKGVPGVKIERFETAKTIKHCALSLVGEPIIYPKINEFIEYLHQKQISTFLVTNAQFPEKITQLKPVTQLYLSIDASTKESLKSIDR